MKSARERMDVISAYRDVGTYRGAAAICGTTHKTVKRIIEAHEDLSSGAALPVRESRARNYEQVADLVAHAGQHPHRDVLMSQLATAYYFLHFLVILPFVCGNEKTLPLPEKSWWRVTWPARSGCSSRWTAATTAAASLRRRRACSRKTGRMCRRLFVHGESSSTDRSVFASLFDLQVK